MVFSENVQADRIHRPRWLPGVKRKIKGHYIGRQLLTFDMGHGSISNVIGDMES